LSLGGDEWHVLHGTLYCLENSGSAFAGLLFSDETISNPAKTAVDAAIILNPFFLFMSPKLL
jgi:hypothetical protein